MVRIITYSLLLFMLFSCAGSPPKLERPVKLYNGAPEKGGICRLTQKAINRVAQKMLKRDDSKEQAPKVIKIMFAPDDIECVDARDKAFAGYGCYSFADIGVQLRWQEALLHSCEKWGSSTLVRTEPAIDQPAEEIEPEAPFVEPEITREDLESGTSL